MAKWDQPPGQPQVHYRHPRLEQPVFALNLVDLENGAKTWSTSGLS
jgi:hypothetical protein